MNVHRALVGGALASLGLIRCASPESSGSDETHFWCSVDADCRPFGSEQVCERNRCAPLPDSYPVDEDGGVALNLPPDPSPGPTADCRAEPPQGASFETTARRLPPTTVPHDSKDFGRIVLNRNGSALAFAVTTHYGTAPDGTPMAQGHLVRWAGGVVSRLGQYETDLPQPMAISCDGLTIAAIGNSVRARALVWNPTGLRALPVGPVPPGQLFSWAEALSESGDAVYGTIDTASTVAVRWSGGGDPEPLFEPFDDVYAWSRDGHVAVHGDGTGAFVLRVGTAAPAAVRVNAIDRCDMPFARNVSTDGRILSGFSLCAAQWELDQTDFVWSEATGSLALPRLARISTVTPRMVAVGNVGTDPEGFVWSPARGLRLLRDVLQEHGVVLPEGTRIHAVADVTNDGRVLTGTCTDGRDPGRINVFRAILPEGALD